MVKKAIICLMVLSCAVICLASNRRNRPPKQAKPNLSGTWKLDKSKGDYVKMSGLKPEADIILVITHTEPEMKVIRKLIWKGQEDIQEWTYYTDGRGEVGRTFIEGSEGKSKTKWDGNKLVSKFSVNQNIGRNRISLDVIQEWRLSADGKTLTQTQKVRQTNFSGTTSTRSSSDRTSEILSNILNPSWGGSEIKRVFSRVD